jgi:hypothetical protein
MTALWVVLTLAPADVKPVETCPAATVTPAGTVRLALFEESGTNTPPAGALPVNVTVQALFPGVLMVAGEQVRLEGTTVTGAVRLTEADWVRPLSEAVMVAFWLVLMVPLVAMKMVLV